MQSCNVFMSVICSREDILPFAAQKPTPKIYETNRNVSLFFSRVFSNVFCSHLSCLASRFHLTLNLYSVWDHFDEVSHVMAVIFFSFNVYMCAVCLYGPIHNW